MELRQLTYFVRVIELRSFTKAAEVLRISQPAIGEQVKNLEAELGTTLLKRHSRGVDPTEPGQLLFTRAKAILKDVEDARSVVREYESGLRGNVTLGLTPGLSESISAAAIERCAVLHPGISVNVIEDLSFSLVNRVVKERELISFAVVSSYHLLDAGEIISQHLFDEHLYAVGSLGIIGTSRDPIFFSELTDYPLILLGNGYDLTSGLKVHLQKLARESDIQLRITHEIQAVSVVKQLLERQLGVSILPLDSVRSRVEEGRLNARLIVSPNITRELNLICSASRALSPAEETVRDTVSKMIVESRLTRDEQ